MISHDKTVATKLPIKFVECHQQALIVKNKIYQSLCNYFQSLRIFFDLRKTCKNVN